MPAQTSNFDDVLQRLCATQKLERDKALSEFEKAEFQECDIITIYHWMVDKLDNASTWEDAYGGLVAGKILLNHAEFSKLQTLGFIEALTSRLSGSHNHEEYRVRIAAGECMGVLCRVGGIPVFTEFVQLVKKGIRDNMERQGDGTELQARMNAEEVFHDTAGWKNLETWMKSLQSLLAGLGTRFAEIRDPELLELIIRGIAHTNRFVRETGYQLMGTLAETHGCHDDAEYMQVARQLSEGLADNWSQVRMAASVATRQFFQHPAPGGPASRDSALSLLVPPMCLNRYYVAEGVRLYSQETWRLITQEKGKELVESHLKSTLEYYIKQTDADNHAVREAACACISEAATKLDKQLLQPHVPILISALVSCFHDDAWPVRDAACVATGGLLSAFPQEAMAQSPDAYLSLLVENLRDSIPSVRQGAAVAIAKVSAACQGTVLQAALAIVEKDLLSVSSQKADDPSAPPSPDKSSRPALFGVVRSAGEVDDKHTDQPMYSCGSLAPKMRKGGGGCHDGRFRRAAEPWEVTDGCVHLLTELGAYCPSLHTQVAHLLETLAQTTEFKHFGHHVYLLESVCRCVPRLGQSLGKRLFKQHMESLLPCLAAGLVADNALTSTAAEEAFRHLSRLLGPSILRGRVEMFDPSLLQRLEHLF